jgi:hypothetical protein
MLLVDWLSALLHVTTHLVRSASGKKADDRRERTAVSDLRRVGIVLAGTIPWVDNSISHQLGMGLSLGCLGHTASQLRAKAREKCASTVCASNGT